MPSNTLPLPTLRFHWGAKLSWVLLFVLLVSGSASAQQQRFYNWYFGNKAAVNFSSGAPVAMTNSQMVTTEGCASISDASGNLMFYTDGITVFNANHVAMPNGTGLMGHASSTQSGIIIQKPLSNTIYYIFTADADLGVNGIRYSEVDMSLGGGLGAVTTNKNILLQTPSCEKLTAVRHCNNRDVWIVSHDWNTNGFRTWLISPTGVNTTPVLSSAGSIINGINQSAYGQLKSNPDGNKLLGAYYGFSGSGVNKFELYDFNNTTGVVSNGITLATETGAYGCEFSPDGRLAYGGTNTGRLVQFDLCAGTTAAIQASKYVVGVLGPFIGSMQLGPDSKVYVSRNTTSLSVISNPNVYGAGCTFQNAAISLAGKSSSMGLPNMASFYIRPPLNPFSYSASCLNVSFTAPSALVSTNSCSGAGNAIVSATWNFGDAASGASNTSTSINPTHTFSAVGNYTVQVILNLGCYNDTIQQTVTVTGFSLSNASTAASCGSNNGTATVTPSVAGVYTYLWSNGQTSATATGLAAGTYTVTATAASGCTATSSVTIASSGSVSASVTKTNVNCFGASTGTASVTASGGASPYTYAWSTGATGASISGLAAGNYTVTTSDASGCSVVTSFSITQPATAFTANNTFTAITCNGANNGSINASVTGGTSPYTYAWSNGATSASISSLSPGIYTLTVTDALGCTATSSRTLTQPAALSFSTSSTTASCGISNGTATLTPSVAGAYTYLWSNGQTTASATGLSAGTYTVTATSAAGCSAIYSINVSSTGSVSGTVTTNNATCFGAANGSATVSGTGGTAPYTYSWSAGGTGATKTGLAAGNYSVTISDVGGCSSTQSFVISQPTALSATATAAAISCSGGLGSASVTVSGGTAPYTYAWSNGSTSTVATGLSNGTSTVLITDAHGCTVSRSVSIAQPSALNGSVLKTAVTCFGGSNGAATSSISGGTLPYSYSWSNGATTANLSNVAAGTYSLIVTDANGCTISLSTNIPQPSALVVSASANVGMCLSTGSASATVSGGTNPYTYLWSNGTTSATAASLLSGTYSVIVTDASGCTSNASTTLTQPSVLTTTMSIVDVSCVGASNGSLTAHPSGGTAPYTYAWANGATTASISGLAPGMYGLTISDANGCSTTATGNIQQPVGMSISTSFTAATCGGNNGTAGVTVSGGTAPYTYAWSTGATQANITGLAPGSYAITITDANGCTSSSSVSIPNTGGLTLAVNVTSNVSCANGSDGAAIAIANGGTAPYTYVWSDGTTGSTLTGVIAGTYTCTVTAANGCTAGQSISITQPTAMTAVVATTAVQCFGAADGTASVQANGGTGAYTYTWSNGANGISVSNLAAGNYSVVIADQNNCSITRSFSLAAPTQIVVNEVVTDVSCAGGSNASINLGISGGSSPYSISWNTGSTGTSINGLIAGNYNYTLIDAFGCTAFSTVNVGEPVQLQASIVSTQPSCYGVANGAADLSVSGGVLPYSIVWSNAATSEDLTGLASGVFTATITDASTCQVQVNTSITAPDSISFTYTQTASSCSGSTGTLLFSAIGGTAPYEYLLDNGSYQASPFFNSLTAGLHTILIRDAAMCVKAGTAIVASPSAVGIQVSNLVDVSCFGGNNGSAQAIVSGGTAPFSISWSSGESGVTASQLLAGANQVTVTDASGCSAFQTFSIAQPNALSLSYTMLPVACYGGSNGALSVSATGGSGSYSFLWDDGSTTAQLTAIPVGFYTVDVRDINGCLVSDTLEVTQPSQPILLQTSISPGNCASNSGTATVIATGGTQPYTYLWNSSPAQNDPTASSLAAGTYTVIVSDSNGCQQSASATLIAQPPLTVIVDSVQAVSCYGLSDGQVALTLQGGTAPFIYQWGIGGQSTAPSNLTGGTYTLTVTDSNGCSGQANFTIPQPIQLAASITPQHVSCFGGSNGRALLSVSGGTQPYSYAWSNGVQTSSNNNIPAGNYTCTITDANGCSVEASTSITEPSELQASMSVQQPGCNGNNNGSILVSAQGGTGFYSYQWSSGSVSPEISGLGPGVYTVNVIDQNGCMQQLSSTLAALPAFVTSIVGDTLICEGEQAVVEVSASGIHNLYSYVWDHGVVGAVLGANPSETTTYHVTVQDSAGCIAQDSVTIIVNHTPQVAIIADDTTACVPFCAKIRAESTTATSFYWTLSNDSSYSSNQIFPCFNEPGVYAVNLAVKDDAGCSATINWSEFITVHPTPQAAFTPFPAETNIEHPTIQFLDQSQGATQYTYYFGDPAQSSVMLNNATFTYQDTGSFEVRLQVKNEYGCANDAMQTVHIGGFTAFYIPQAFTPGNGDGVNDVFLPKSTGMAPTGFEMSIYDRWGHLVFYSDSWEKGWDGTLNGQPVPVDMYVCKIRYYDTLGNGNDRISAVTVTE